LRQKVRTSTFK